MAGFLLPEALAIKMRGPFCFKGTPQLGAKRELGRGTKKLKKTYERKLLLMERVRLLVSDSRVVGRRIQRRRSRGNPWLREGARGGL